MKSQQELNCHRDDDLSEGSVLKDDKMIFQHIEMVTGKKRKTFLSVN